MSARLERALKALFKQQRGREVLVLLTLYVSRVVGPSYKNFERKFGFKKAIAAAQYKSSHERKQDTFQNGQGSEQDSWDWRDIPSFWPALRAYQLFANTYMTTVILKNLFPSQLQTLINLFKLPKPAHCYFFGHTTIHEAIDKYCAILFCSFHLGWRLLQRYVNRDYHPSLCFFMLITDHDLDKFSLLIDERNKRILSLMRHSKKSSQLIGRWSLIGQMKCHMDNELRCEENKIDNKIESELDERRQNFFINILCFKIETGSCVFYKLRPNRTKEARLKLLAKAARVTKWIILLLGGAVVLITPAITIRVLSDEKFLRIYPNCDHGLEQRRQAGELASWSVTLSESHRWMSLIFDILENFIILFDSGLACAGIWPTIYMLNFDLLLYWRHLDREFKFTYARIRARYSESCQEERAANLLKSMAKTGNSKSNYRAADTGASSRFALERVSDMNLEDSIYSLQSECCDFFAKIREADRYVSDMITGTVCIWLASFSVLGHFSLNHYMQNDDLFLVLIILVGLLIGFAAISVASFNLLSLHKNCLKSYTTICSMMAYDQSQHKRGFLKLLDFYTVRKQSAYTLFQQYPYTSTTYLSVFGWSFSCLFILDGLTRQRQRHGWV